MPHDDSGLAPRYLALRDEAQALCDSVAAFVDEAEESSEFDVRLQDAFRKSGLADLLVRGRDGGRYDEIDPLALCVVREVLMESSAQLDALFSLQGIGSYALGLVGTGEQRSRWLPGVRSGELLPAMALTEPAAGSDLKAITTTVVAEGTDLVVTGTKSFISDASVASFFTVLAREGDGYSLVLVPAGTPGLTVEAGPELIAAHCIGDVRFDGVRVPATAGRLGGPGEGFPLVLATLTIFRASVAGAAVGLAQAALTEAVRHTRSREAFGRPLARHGPVATLLADSAMEIEMARLLAYRAAERAREGADGSLDYSSMAKVAATEMAGRVVDRCVQVMGRFGLVRGSRIERLYRQARPMRIYEGATEVLRLGIARALTEQID